MPIPRWRTRSTGRKPSPRFASVVGHTQMRAPACPSRSSSRPSACVACTTVVRGPRQPQSASSSIGRSAVLGEALLDLARLLVRVHVQRQPVLRRRSAELLEPVARAGAHGVGGDADADACGAELLEPAQVVGDRRLAEAVDAAARVGDVEEHELDARFGRRLGRRVRLGQAEVVELADGGVAGGAHLPVDPGVALADPSRCLTPGQVQHGLPPRPEVLALVPAAQAPLEGVAVGVDEPRELEICPPRARGYACAAAPPGRGAGMGVLLRALPLARAGTVAIFYYPWYGTPAADGAWQHWDQNGHRPPADLYSSFFPALGPYSSSDPAVVERQMTQIAPAGVDEVVVSWWGRGSAEDARLPLVVAAARRHGLLVGDPPRALPGPLGRPPSRSTSATSPRSASATSTSTTRATSPAADWAAVRAQVPSTMRLFAGTEKVGFAAAGRFDGVYTYDFITNTGAKFARLCAQAHAHAPRSARRASAPATTATAPASRRGAASAGTAPPTTASGRRRSPRTPTS